MSLTSIDELGSLNICSVIFCLLTSGRDRNVSTIEPIIAINKIIPAHWKSRKKSVYTTFPNATVFVSDRLIGELRLLTDCSLKSQGTNARISSINITNPIKIPKGRYCATPLLKPAKLILSIITTNRNKTASAPTYTIIRSRAKNSAPTRIKKPATEKKVTISHSTE